MVKNFLWGVDYELSVEFEMVSDKYHLTTSIPLSYTLHWSVYHKGELNVHNYGPAYSWKYSYSIMGHKQGNLTFINYIMI